MINFKNIYYLLEGNEFQKKCYFILEKIKIFEIMKEYNPILVGTIPLGINVKDSDLDIVCQQKDLEKIKYTLIKEFSKYEKFICRKKDSSLVANFFVEGIEIEIYCSEEISEQTNGYRHMVVEDRILKLANLKFKNDIKELKEKKIKTEQAFCSLLNLIGNPYEEILKLEFLNDLEIYNKLPLKYRKKL